MENYLLKDNLYIAEFMGETINDSRVLHIKDKIAKWSAPMYSESWDWLMKAVDLCLEIANKETECGYVGNIKESLIKADLKSTFKNVLIYMRLHVESTPRYFEIACPTTGNLIGSVAIKNKIIPLLGISDLSDGWEEYLACEQDDLCIDAFVEYFNGDDRDSQIVIERLILTPI